jgi:hypothetical protein
VKIGAENKKQLRWMIAVLAVLALVIIYDLVFMGGSSSASPAPSSSTAASQPKKAGAATTQIADNTLDPRVRIDLLAASQSKKYEPGRNIFRMEEAPPPTVVGSVRQQAAGPPAPPTPTPVPPPPPIPLKFYGFANKPNEAKRVFLVDEGEVFVARQGEIVERRYKIVQINTASVVIEDALTSNKQTIQMTAR